MPSIETNKAAAAFDEYCELGPGRSLAKLAKKLDKNVGQLERWSSQFQWVLRAREYDREQAAERRHAQEEAVARMNEEHALLGQTQAQHAVKLIEDLIIEQRFTPAAAVQLLKISVDLERVARGASTEQIALTGKDGGAIEYHDSTNDLTDDDLAMIIAGAQLLAQKRNANPPDDPPGE